jgi:DHA2 family multidrug resistance protein
MTTTPGRVINPWLVAVVVVIPAFMEVLDTTIANVALRYIAGGLSAAETDSEWVITSYLAANAIILPLTGWITAHLGRRNYFLFSICLFTVASMLCGFAPNLETLIVCRVLQGLAGGGLQPCSQGILLDSFPPEKQGSAQALFAMAALVAPVFGPTLGGWITEAYSWRWIFFINGPIGVLAFFAAFTVVRDPDYLVAARNESRKLPLRFDSIGLGLLILTIAAWEVLLSKGQEWDWLGDPFGRIQTLLACFVFGLGGLIFWELRHPQPVVNFRPLRERNFAIASVIIFFSFAVLLAASTQLPMLLESLFGYDSLNAGLVLSPSGFFTVTATFIAGRLLGIKIDARWLIGAGLLITAAGNFWMSRMNLQIEPSQAVWPRCVLTVGLGFIFAPINVAAFLYIPKEMRGAAVGLFALLRNEGGSFGTTVAQTITERREIFHTLRLNEFLDPLNPAVMSYLQTITPNFVRDIGDPVAAKEMALQALSTVRDQQALSLAYFDAFFILAVVGVALACLVPLMKRSVVEKKTAISAE